MQYAKFFFKVFLPIFLIAFSYNKKWNRFALLVLISFVLAIPSFLAQDPLNISVSISLQNSIELGILSFFLIYFSYRDKLDDKYYIIALFLLGKAVL